ncbi:MAG: rRNA maturation RNase YbeY [Flavobacteriales bacterium]|nr:rRNA maturation RNase YbeY [Flavobacteriales bacterium]
MILFHSETNFQLKQKAATKKWIIKTIVKEGKTAKDINFIFCDDTFLHEKNKTYLGHDTLTDIITFDYSDQDLLSGDIFISINRVRENASIHSTPFENELSRVIIHGVLHLLGYNDKSKKEKGIMREKEDFYLSLQT